MRNVSLSTFRPYGVCAAVLGLSRRALMKGAVGAGVASALGAIGGMRSAVALAGAPGIGCSQPDPGRARDRRHNLPYQAAQGLLHPADDEPISIFDFDGAVADFTFEDHGPSHAVYISDPDGHRIEITTYEL